MSKPIRWSRLRRMKRARVVQAGRAAWKVKDQIAREADERLAGMMARQRVDLVDDGEEERV